MRVRNEVDHLEDGKIWERSAGMKEALWESLNKQEECLGRERCKLACTGHPLGGSSQIWRGIRDYRQINTVDQLLNGKGPKDSANCLHFCMK